MLPPLIICRFAALMLLLPLRHCRLLMLIIFASLFRFLLHYFAFRFLCFFAIFFAALFY